MADTADEPAGSLAYKPADIPKESHKWDQRLIGLLVPSCSEGER